MRTHPALESCGSAIPTRSIAPPQGRYLSLFMSKPCIESGYMYVQKPRLRGLGLLSCDPEVTFNPVLVPYIDNLHLQCDVAIPPHVQGLLEDESATP